jgi:hypothetical protein
MDPAAAPIANNLIVQYGLGGVLIVGMAIIIYALWRWAMSLLRDAAAERKEQQLVDRETAAAINKLSAVIEAGQRARP